MTHRARRTHPGGGPGPAGLLEGAALVCILSVTVAWVFVAGTPFRWAPLVFRPGSPAQLKRPMEELIRLTLSMILLGGVSLWALGQLARRRFQLAGASLAVMIVLFAAVSFPSTRVALDARGALNGWVEQVSVLLAALVMIQLARQRRRWGLVVVVLAAVGVVLAARTAREVGWEIPDRVAHFKQHADAVLRQKGIEPGSSRARMYENRVLDASATGYFGLANVFGSLLIVLSAAAVGLAVEKLVAARHAEPSGPHPPGETRLPAAAGIVTVLLATGCVAALILTRSKGALAAAVPAGAIAAAVLARPAFFARHRRRLLIASAAVLVGAMLAVWAWGAARGGLPGRSMQVRWQYWVGAARTIGESPLPGVGPFNFGDAYLKHRLLGADEAVKTAHNVAADAACAFGLPAAALYLAILVWMVLAVTRPAAEQAPPDAPGAGARGMVGWCVLLPLVAFAARMLWEEPSTAGGVLREAIFPAAALAVALPAMMWTGRNLAAAGLCGRRARVFLAAGTAGFLLHNLVTYSLFSPGTCTAFWIAAAAVAAPALRPRELPGGKALAIAAAGAAVAGTIAAGTWLWRPVKDRSEHVRAANFAYGRMQFPRAAAELEAAIDADKLDGIPAFYLHKMYMAWSAHARPSVRDAYLARAVRFAELAYERSPTPACARSLAQALDMQGAEPHRALEMAATAVRDDPMNASVRWEAAEMLFRAGRLQEAAAHLRRIRRIEAALPAESDMSLSPRQLEDLDRLAEQIRAAVEARSASTRAATSQMKATP